MAALLVTTLAGARAQAESTIGGFNTLVGLKTDVDLPDETSGSAASVHRTLRPALSYPTLHVRSPASEAKPDPDAESLDAEPAAQPATSEFEDIVEATVGYRLPVFGQTLFSASDSRYAPVDQVTVPADFIIGPGDELHIQAWGAIELDVRMTVDRGGCITLPKIGEIPLAGVRFADLRQTITAALRRAYHGFELSVTLGRLKNIGIYVTGYANAPGRHTVSSLASLINAIFTTGGPSRTGDMRRIELHRGGADTTAIDLYRFLLDGDRADDLRLSPDDLIHVPPLSGQVAVAGSVRSPAIFHLAPKDSVADVLEYAGGLTPAFSHRLILERFGSGGERLIEALALDEQGLATELEAGDILLVTPGTAEFMNAVTLRGHVAQPLRHEWRPGMRVSDLLPDAEALISPAYWRERNAADRLTDLLKPRGDTALTVSFPDINWTYAAIERIGRDNAAEALVPFHLGKAVLDREAAHDVLLEPGDVITVFAMSDFAVPVDDARRFVRIEGEVARAGVYPVRDDETLSDLIEKAGGMTSNAYLLGMELSRESVRKRQQQRMDAAIDRLDQDYQRHLIDRSRNVLSGDLSMAIPPEADAIAALVTRLRSVQPTGRIVLEFDQLEQGAAGLPPLRLRDQDRVYIPPKPETVEIVGAVMQSGSTLFRSGRRIKEYLGHAGFIPTADRGEIYLVRPNGAFEKARSRQTLLPGDTIVVPEKVERQAFVRRLKDWTQVLYQFGLGAAGLAILNDV